MTFTQNRFFLLAIAAGGLLAVMIQLNSQLANSYSPIGASWLTHGIGALTAVLLLAMTTKRKQTRLPSKSVGLIGYLGGIPGALTVLVAGITVNSFLGLSGTLALAIVGQVFFSYLCDFFGWFGLKKVRASQRDIVALLLITGGSLLIVLSAGK